MTTLNTLRGSRLTDLDVSILVEEFHASLEAGEATLATLNEAHE